ncbi:MAG: hypothetical protein JWO06_836, partial [Bacteroidota bacterium]|nr:hypothetical protein [Bacteroidota bacterium]
MKTKLLLFIILLCSAYLSRAQLAIGQSVVTESGTNLDDQVVKIFDVSLPSTDVNGPGNNWGLPNTIYSNWYVQDLGQVFGLAINTQSDSPNHVIYASASQIYGATAIETPTTVAYNNGFREFKYIATGVVTFNDNTPLVWELNPNPAIIGGGRKALVVSTTSTTFPPTTPNAIFNRGTAIGNICYDKDHDQIFVTNMEDGRIYRIDASTGAIKSRYDPFKPYHDNGVSEFVPLVDRLWGIAYKRNKLYFASWREDYGHQSDADTNGVYSVNIDNTPGPTYGEFTGSGVSSVAPGDLVDPYPTEEITFGNNNAIVPIKLPPFALQQYSNPIASIQISADGQTMLLGERTMFDAYDDGTYAAFAAWAHRARVLRYDISGSTWTASTQDYFVGDGYVNNYLGGIFQSTNCAGGVDFGYNDTATVIHCEKMVWATGDALKLPPDRYTGINEAVYGIAGIPSSGNTTWDNSGGSPSTAVNNSSIYQDIFYQYGSDQGNKSRPGDVVVYRDPCSCFRMITLNANGPPCTCGGACSVWKIFGGSAPYDYHWSTGETTSGIGGLCPGNLYTLTLTDANGCTATGGINIPGPAPMVLVMSETDASCSNICDGTVSVNVQLGAMPYSFEWSNSGGISTPDSKIGGVCSGDYSVTVTDAHGCTASASITVNAASAPTGYLNVPDSVCLKDSIIIFFGGGYYYRFIIDGQPDQNYFHDDIANRMVVTKNDLTLGCHLIQLVVSMDETFLCTDTVSDSVCVFNCSICDSVIGHAALVKSKTGALSYEFYDNWSREPNYVNWYVDGVKQDQTTPSG